MMWNEDILIYLGIVFCISQSAMFSGLNLAFFSLSRLQLEVEVKRGNEAAKKVQNLREDSNFLLTTILWGNVGINVLLTLLSDSVMTGVSSFLFSTIVITLVGEITPQAYFSRHALVMASRLSFAIKFYQIVLFVVAKPSALVLDKWLGREGITYFAEGELRSLIRRHIEAEEAEVDHVEGIGALNFLAIDELPVTAEGEIIHPESIIVLPTKMDLPEIPEIQPSATDPFLQQLHKSRHSWVILSNAEGWPLLVIDADGCLRAALFEPEGFDPYDYCHRPIIITDETTSLGDAIWRIKANESMCKLDDSVIEHDVLLIWGEEKRIITGADIFGRLLKGIIPPENGNSALL